jgi:hypothetical protein
MIFTRGPWAGLLGLVAMTLAAAGCNDGGVKPPTGGGGSGGQGAAGGLGGAGGAPLTVTTVSVSTANPTPRTGTWSVNYWTWAPTFGDALPGTETLVAALTPTFMRVGGYNNDANTPDTFDDAQLDAMVTYARAIGAEPILQVPHLAADKSGTPATAANAAAMVTYANVTKGYGIKYFSIGNEPDLYDSMGLPSDSSQPAIPGYTPTAYCASITDYVTAMKAVDPTIKIVGPDLAYKYQAGAGLSLDWLTPILQTCGAEFDIIAIHRYPFEAAMATLPSAAADPVHFRQVMTSVQGILQTTGQGQKPLALTEMNVAYDATNCVLGASPGTVGSALWMADIVGSSLELGLWTSAVWDISDPDDWSLGIIGLPPKHVPRPEYYAFALYAAHFGPTMLPVPTGLPAGVSAYASRNAANTGTALIVINWNESPVALKLQLSSSVAPTYLFPAVSIGAVEIPDSGGASAWIYSEAERVAAVGPQPITEGTAPAGGVDGGAGGPAGRAVGTNCPGSDAGFICPSVPVASPTITVNGASHASAPLVTFGAPGDGGASQVVWGSYSYTAPGQPTPTAALAPDGKGLHITGSFVAPLTGANDYQGVGLYYSSASCLDATGFTGVSFDFAGHLGGCQLGFGVSFSADQSAQNDPQRGGCPPSASACYPPSADVTAQAQAADGGAAINIKVPFSAPAGGMPVATEDPSTILTVQWQLTGPTGAGDGGVLCAADFTVENVKFY